MATYSASIPTNAADEAQDRDPLPVLLGAHPVSNGQLGVFGVALMALMLDGLDIQLLAFFTPLILAEWRVDRAMFGPALAAAMVGMAVGASVGGWIGDRIGRRPVVVTSVFIFGLGTAALSVTHDLLTLTVLRFISGVAFGAAIPNAFALTSEWLPHRARARAIGVLAVSSPMGGMVGAGLTLVLLPLVGWRWCFAISGLGTMALAAVMFTWLPESASFLLSRNKREAAARELKRIARVTEMPDVVVPASRETRRGTIFIRSLARLNVGGALAFFTSNFVTAAMSSWAPTILVVAGLPISNAISGSLLFNSLAIGGGLMTARLIARRGSKGLLIGTALAGLLALIAMGAILLHGRIVPLSVGSFVVVGLTGLVGLFVGGSFTAIWMIVSVGYPVPERAFGIGFSAMAGRIGGIVAILVGGLLLKLGGSTPTPLFVVLAACMAVVAAAAFVIDLHVDPVDVGTPGSGRASQPADAAETVPLRREVGFGKAGLPD